MNLKHQGGGLSFFQQSVYAIEMFIHKRIQQGFFKTDKYFLFGIEHSDWAPTADEKPGKYSKVLGDLTELLDGAKSEPDLSQPKFSKKKEQSYASRLYSGWQHTYKHFYSQL